MNLFDQYGIKEVADVTLYSIHKKQDGSGDLYYVPAIYFDTLKVSTVEQTADSTWAQGGLGNKNLIGWDSNKTINVSLEDALCTPASLGLCWNGILSANWKDGHVKFNSEVCGCENPVKRLSRMEKVFYPRSDKANSCISNLLPQISADAVDNYLGLLKISSVVDGTDVRGFGMVKNHTYRWKMAIESVVQSIAVVPDRFFDIKGKSYPIDWDRKVSVHSLPTYESYKDAIIYKINSKGRCHIPPMAKIIFDEAMASQGEIVTLTLENYLEDVSDEVDNSTITLAKYLEENGFTLYEEGYFSKTENDETTYYIPFESFDTRISGIYIAAQPTTLEDDAVPAQYKFSYVPKAFQLAPAGIESLLPNCRNEVTADAYDNTLVSYLQNHAHTNTKYIDRLGSITNSSVTCDIKDGEYLAIIVDNNDNYIPLIGKITDINNEERAKSTVSWYKPTVDIDTTQFKGIDMWLRFESINEMIYYLITKYEDNILSINPASIKALNQTGSHTWAVNDNYTTVLRNTDQESEKAQGKLWAYVNPRTMAPYSDDYWFSEGEPYYIKSLTLAPKGKRIKGNKIVVKADQWPGNYMFVGETWLRDRDTGNDQRLQIKIPMCKVKSDQSLTLEAAGDPVVFNLDLEVATPKSGKMMDVTAYEIATKMVAGENGCYYAVDGSSEVLSE